MISAVVLLCIGEQLLCPNCCRFYLRYSHRCAADLGFLGFAVVEVPARVTFCDILGLLHRYTSSDVPEAIVFAASGCYPCLGAFACVFALPGWNCLDIWLHLSPVEDYWKWQIKGLGLAAWQRDWEFAEAKTTGGVHGCIHMCVKYLPSEETLDPFGA